MNKHIIIRRAEEADAENIIRFNIAMAKETESKDLNRDLVGRGVKNLLSHPEYGFYIVAELDKQVIGSLMITFEWSDWRNGLFWWIQSVYILPEYRRKGVFRLMYLYIHEKAGTEQTVCGLRLYVDNDNEIAQKTYFDLGMKRTGYGLFEEEL
ncbi:GNAT family N-acetyltransferase [candidate division KSB1 bacterium]|nr:GNAT family N-acetyltransferase [candidate division KSB1 bacterium]